MEEAFDREIAACLRPLERYVRFRISHPQDAQDVLQEVLSSAVQNAGTLREPSRMLEWLLGIARHKCMDYYRLRHRRQEVLVEALPQRGCYMHAPEDSPVQQALRRLSPADRQLLHLVYWQELPQKQIARQLGIPLGTVKSRLHHARSRFQREYTALTPMKGTHSMKTNAMPAIMPEYTVTPTDKPLFPVRWEELMGWFIVPRLGEKLSWAAYDFPERVRTEWDDMTVTGRAMIHGIEGVEITSVAHTPMECNATDGAADVTRTLVAQLTDTHCRILSESHVQDGVRRLYTFLDGDSFLNNWGFGEDNCGNEIQLVRKGDIHRSGAVVTTATKPFLLDVIDRCDVTINGRTYDTLRVMDVMTYNEDCVSEQFIDRQGRTVLWRRFNPDDWHFSRYGRLWTEMLPDNERITVNGKTCVHWYDCITSYIL